MADFGLTSSADGLRSGQGGEPMEISFSRNTRASLALHSISVAEIKRALYEGEVVSTDAGHYVIRLDEEQGGIHVMADKEGHTVIVRTAVRPDELLANAG
jgi:hypothetical protein